MAKAIVFVLALIVAVALFASVRTTEAQTVETEISASVEIRLDLLPEGDGLSGIVMDVSVIEGGPQSLLCLPNPTIQLTACEYLQTTRFSLLNVPGGLGAAGDTVSLGWVIVKGESGDTRTIFTNVLQADSLTAGIVNFPHTVSTVTIP